MFRSSHTILSHMLLRKFKGSTPSLSIALGSNLFNHEDASHDLIVRLVGEEGNRKISIDLSSSRSSFWIQIGSFIGQRNRASQARIFKSHRAVPNRVNSTRHNSYKTSFTLSLTKSNHKPKALRLSRPCATQGRHTNRFWYAKRQSDDVWGEGVSTHDVQKKIKNSIKIEQA